MPKGVTSSRKPHKFSQPVSLVSQVSQVFAPQGRLAVGLDDFRPRAGQAQMAVAVARVLEQGGQLVVEAGTGIGKTYAYLVPALLSGRRVLLSTASKALQDQLFGRDIPHLMKLLGVTARVAVLKGRGSYVCPYYLGRARQSVAGQGPEAALMLAHLERWVQATRSGDLAEVPALDDDSPLIPWVTSTRESCLGSSCPQIGQCFVNQARRQALDADLVVVNHHLFFADLAIRESGVAELLPAAECVVFDEAHQLNEIGVQFSGIQVSASQWTGLARDLRQRAGALAGGYAPWDALAQAIEVQGQALADRFAPTDSPQRLDWQVLGSGGQAQLERLLVAVQDASVALSSLAAMGPEMQTLAARAGNLFERLQSLVGLPTDTVLPEPEVSQVTQKSPAMEVVRWLEIGRHLRLFQAPLDIAGVMRSRIAPPDALAAGKSWIFTSATLGHDARLRWFVDSCGLEDAECLQVSSPFNYAEQAALYVPTVFAAPSDPQHSPAVAALALQGAEILGGRTMVLTTSLRAMRAIGEALRSTLGVAPSLEVLVQGEMPKREILARFAEAAKTCEPNGDTVTGRRGAVLVASAGFWEGIDIAGSTLQLVVIDKLPFAPPDDPVQQARAQRLVASGKNAFNSLHLPQAAVALKQGAGRLIRRETDQGVVVVCDVRLRQKGYGAKLLAALPPMAHITTPEAFYARLATLTTVSTTDAELPSVR